MAAPSPADVQARLDAERAGAPFLVFRDDAGRQHIHPLAAEAAPISVGRAAETAVRLTWDSEVSRLHAELALAGGQWVLVDDGLSRNGSFVNGERLAGRRRLLDGDALRFGETLVHFHQPGGGAAQATAAAADTVTAAGLTEAQRRVLVALCRPFKGAGSFATAATNAEIAAELHLSVDAVKGHLRVLFAKFGVAEEPQAHKRARLAERAFLTGVVTERDL